MTTNRLAFPATWTSSQAEGILFEMRSDLTTMQEIAELTRHLSKIWDFRRPSFPARSHHFRDAVDAGKVASVFAYISDFVDEIARLSISGTSTSLPLAASNSLDCVLDGSGMEARGTMAAEMAQRYRIDARWWGWGVFARWQTRKCNSVFAVVHVGLRNCAASSDHFRCRRFHVFQRELKTSGTNLTASNSSRRNCEIGTKVPCRCTLTVD